MIFDNSCIQILEKLHVINTHNMVFARSISKLLILDRPLSFSQTFIHGGLLFECLFENYLTQYL